MQNKRFISGALCPQCKEVDKVYTYLQDDKSWRACANCDFKESFSAHEKKVVEELATRVNQHRLGEQALPHEVPTEAVVFIDPRK